MQIICNNIKGAISPNFKNLVLKRNTGKPKLHVGALWDKIAEED